MNQVHLSNACHCDCDHHHSKATTSSKNTSLAIVFIGMSILSLGALGILTACTPSIPLADAYSVPLIVGSATLVLIGLIMSTVGLTLLVHNGSCKGGAHHADATRNDKEHQDMAQAIKDLETKMLAMKEASEKQATTFKADMDATAQNLASQISNHTRSDHISSQHMEKLINSTVDRAVTGHLLAEGHVDQTTVSTMIDRALQKHANDHTHHGDCLKESEVAQIVAKAIANHERNDTLEHNKIHASVMEAIRTHHVQHQHISSTDVQNMIQAGIQHALHQHSLHQHSPQAQTYSQPAYAPVSH